MKNYSIFFAFCFTLLSAFGAYAGSVSAPISTTAFKQSYKTMNFLRSAHQPNAQAQQCEYPNWYTCDYACGKQNKCIQCGDGSYKCIRTK